MRTEQEGGHLQAKEKSPQNETKTYQHLDLELLAPEVVSK